MLQPNQKLVVDLNSLQTREGIDELLVHIYYTIYSGLEKSISLDVFDFNLS